jgi:NifU-like protein involved in Fe-S cluster formation
MSESDGRRHASLMTDGCGPSVACGSRLTATVQDMSLEEARKIKPEGLIAALDGLPEESVHSRIDLYNKERKV